MAAASRVQPLWSPLYPGQVRKTSIRALVSPMRLAVGAAIRSPGRLAAAVHRAGRAFDRFGRGSPSFARLFSDRSSARRTLQGKGRERCVRWRTLATVSVRLWESPISDGFCTTHSRW